MKILVFLQGTVLMHKGGMNKSREERVIQVKNLEKTVLDFKTYIPIGGAVAKLQTWSKQGAEIMYMSAHIKPENATIDQNLLKKYHFPEGQLYYRKKGEKYHSILERLAPVIIIEDDCESIGGVKEMAITYVNLEKRRQIKPIIVPEFGGIDHLSDELTEL